MTLPKISTAAIGLFVAIGIGLATDAALHGDKSLLNTGMSYVYAPTPPTPPTPAKAPVKTHIKTAKH